MDDIDAQREGEQGSASGEPYVPGMVIAGKYRLEAPIGEGGMGTVWRARNLTLEAPVAIKLIRHDLQQEPMILRLLTEARVEARLKHPNLVRVFDFGQTETGGSYIVMECLEGVTLGDLMEHRGRLDSVEAVQLLLPIVSALCHAHENGVIHRDLKPHNVFLDRVGLHTAPKLLDFGVAKLLDEPELHRAESGTLLGSPAYMAPEQAQGLADVDHRADIWATCVVLYEAISGAPAFPGDGYAVLRSVISDTLQPLPDRGTGEDTLWPILARGLEKDPQNRYQSMYELGSALARWLDERGESEDLEGNRISRSWGLARSEESEREAPADEIAIEVVAEPQTHELELLALGNGETWPGFVEQPRPRYRAFAIAAAVAAAIALSWSPAQTASEPLSEAVRSPAADHAQATTDRAPDAREAEASLERFALAHAEIDRAAPLLLTDAARDPEPLPAGVDAVPAQKRPARRSTEAELGLKVPY